MKKEQFPINPLIRDHTQKMTDQRGFALIEAILAASLFSLVIAAFAGALIVSQQNSFITGNVFRAALLAQEGLEAVRNLRDDDFSNLTDGDHGLVATDGAWHFQDDPDTPDIFTREIDVSPVDENTKKIVSTVSWNGLFGQPQEVSLTSYLTNWRPSPP